VSRDEQDNEENEGKVSGTIKARRYQNPIMVVHYGIPVITHDYNENGNEAVH
jgi:hypothetical protein